jgi:hypothetical protein
MDTSSSAERSPIAGIDVYSGRPNPTWPLQSAELDRLRAIWNELRKLPTTQTPQVPGLGYRGCFVLDGDERWNAFREVVTLQRAHDRESRLDERHECERLILASAPADIAVDTLVGSG